MEYVTLLNNIILLGIAGLTFFNVRQTTYTKNIAEKALSRLEGIEEGRTEGRLIAKELLERNTVNVN